MEDNIQTYLECFKVLGLAQDTDQTICLFQWDRGKVQTMLVRRHQHRACDTTRNLDLSLVRGT